MQNIVKRDGIIVPYDKSKITNAIYKAARVVGGTDYEKAKQLADHVEKILLKKYSDTSPSVEQIQDIVERTLIKFGYADTAKEYILYRDKRDRIRDSNSQLISTIRNLTLEDSSTMDLKRENANIDGNSPMGIMLRYGSEASKRFSHLNLLRPEHSKAHLSGLIHIHDLDFYPITINCLTEDMEIRLNFLGNDTTVSIGFFDNFFLNTGKTAISFKILNVQVRSYDPIENKEIWTPLISAMRRPLGDNEKIFCFRFGSTCLKVTGNHLLPIKRNGAYKEIKAKNITKDDIFTLNSNLGFINSKPDSIDIIENYKGYVYDLETKNHLFIANNVVVHNCIQLDLTHLFSGGFSTGHGKLREPSDIRSAASLAAIAIQSDQNDMFGGQSVAKFDYDMAKYVAKTFVKELCRILDYEEVLTPKQLEIFKKKCKRYIDENGHILDEKGKDFIKNLLAKEIPNSFSFANPSKYNFALEKAFKYTSKATYQAMEAFIHNMNTLQSRAGSQVPFSSVNYGTDTSIEGRMVTKNLLYALQAGLGDGETPIFPIHVFKVKDGINGEKGDPNYDLFHLACETSAKRLFPNFVFIDAPYNLQYYKKGRPETEAATMGCRTRVVANIDKDNEIFTRRGNLSFTSMNLVRMAILANHNIDKFFDILDNTIDMVIQQLLDRYKVQCNRKAKNLPFSMLQHVYLGTENLKPNDSIEPAIKHGTLTIGFIGLAECLVALIGKHHGESVEAQELGLRIIGRIRERTDMATEEYHLNFSTIGTPAEGLCLAGDTLVHTENGLKRIDEIKVGDKVYTLNEDEMEIELDEVAKAGMTFKSHEVLKLSFNDNVDIITTPLHPFAIDSPVNENAVSYMEAKNLLPICDMDIWSLDIESNYTAIRNKHAKVKANIALEEKQSVFNLTMKKNNNFFISKLGILVHNSGRFLQIDKKEFGVIKGVTDKDYYTNSNHVPVYFPISMAKKIELEAPYHALENGGHICYVEMDGDPSQNVEAFEKVIQYMKKCGIGYGSVNHHGADFDPVCGYHGQILDVCPRCGRRDGEPIDDALLEKYKNRQYIVDDEIGLKDQKED